MQNHNSKFKVGVKQRASQFALRIIKLLDLLPREMSCQVIGRQLLRSATSIGANIVEARGASSKRDFTKFFTYSLKSANESLFWLQLLKDSNKAKGIDMSQIIQEAIEIANILGSSVLTLKGKNK